MFARLTDWKSFVTLTLIFSRLMIDCPSAPHPAPALISEDAFAARQSDAWRASEDETRARIEAALSAAREKMEDELQRQRDEFQARRVHSKKGIRKASKRIPIICKDHSLSPHTKIKKIESSTSELFDLSHEICENYVLNAYYCMNLF